MYGIEFLTTLFLWIAICVSRSSSLSPVIGVLAERCNGHATACRGYEATSKSFVVASYVKALEAAGGVVVPVHIGRDEAYYSATMRSINGLLLPGGKSLEEDYKTAVRHTVAASKKLHDQQGIDVPIFGVCLGMGALLYDEFGERVASESACNATRNDKLKFKDDYGQYEMFRHAPSSVIADFADLPIAIQANTHCINERLVASLNMSSTWHVTSLLHDDADNMHAATVEHAVYPFFGVSFHPEKSAYEWHESRYRDNFPAAIVSNRYFYDFFVQKSQRSNNNNTLQNVGNYSIYNYAPSFTGKDGGYFVQTYVF
ncbi:hypothetical protein [Heliothis virescens ascovirus 3g]|uniref:folate gamma-glutamyl hydrolase n=1 Tax=Heliothis virescens ascovirus 3g TaxID=1246651 RepID=K4NVM1_9VIRU|nr:hypothetical protein F8204_gp099 [Heliothis virescens ascovirus 3g]AFV50351.1 hypothetical protein [Heliothis virescens ascovirus 3g]